MTPRILAFAASARRESLNRKLLEVAVAGATTAGAACTVVDLRDYPLPLYDGDLEAAEGLPENARQLKALCAEHGGLLVATPEYNGFIPPLLKNTLDWMTRSEKASPDLAHFGGKVVALMAASPGPLGGLRSLGLARQLFTNLGCIVLPGQMTLRTAHEAFTPEGTLSNERYQQTAEGLGADLATWVARAEQ